MLAPTTEGGLVGLAVAALVAVTLLPRCAQAAPAEAEVQSARRLFVEAEKDEDAARWADALDKLRRVAQVKFTAGIHYHIALCEEHLGQLATALDQYTSAEGQARAENAQDVLSLVGKRIEDLGPRVPRLTLRLPPGAGDAAVTLDGARLPLAVLGTALPVDPGEHSIEVSTLNRPTTMQTVTLRERDMTTVDLKVAEAPPRGLPAGAVGSSARTAPPGLVSPREGLRGATGERSRTGAVLATAGAVVLAGGGVVAFLLAGGAHSTAVEECSQVLNPPAACDPQRNSVRRWDFAAAGAWLGAAAAGTVAVIEWARPPSQAAASAPSAQLLIGPVSLELTGRF